MSVTAATDNFSKRLLSKSNTQKRFLKKSTLNHEQTLNLVTKADCNVPLEKALSFQNVAPTLQIYDFVLSKPYRLEDIGNLLAWLRVRLNNPLVKRQDLNLIPIDY